MAAREPEIFHIIAIVLLCCVAILALVGYYLTNRISREMRENERMRVERNRSASRLNALATRRQSTLSTVETPLAKAEASSPLIKLKPELGESSIAAAKGISVLSLLHPDSIEAVPERSTAPKAPLGRENQAIQPGPRQFGALPLFDSDTPEDEENDEVLQYLREQAERHPTDRIDRSAISAANLNSSSLYELANSGDKERTKRLHDEAEFESESLEGGHTDPKQRLLYLHKRHRNASMSDEKEDVDSYLV